MNKKFKATVRFLGTTIRYAFDYKYTDDDVYIVAQDGITRTIHKQVKDWDRERKTIKAAAALGTLHSLDVDEIKAGMSMPDVTLEEVNYE